MSCKNITKKFFFVTILSLFCSGLAGCGLISSNDSKAPEMKGASTAAESSIDYQKPRHVGAISSNEISESSGLVNSRCNPDVLWTHNDSGDAAFVFALSKSGEKLGTWKVQGAENDDWEDLATFKNADSGECFLYVGDIGNNARDRGELTVYVVKEPTVSSRTDSSKKKPLLTETARPIKFEYPDVRHDAESLMVHPQTGDIYVLSKSISGASGVYKLAAANYSPDKTYTLEKIADFSVPAMPTGFLTGAEISPDGKRVVICDYFTGYEIALPAQAKNFDDVWKEKPLKIELGERKQGEAICYSADGRSILATSEKRNSPIIEVRRK